MVSLTRKLGVAAALALASVVAFAGPAFAHNYYVSSTPGVKEVLTALPDQFSVTTSDNLLDLSGAVGGFFMEVKGPGGLYFGDGCVTVSGPSVTMPAALGPAGDYTLQWQVISADGHTVSGEVPFSWQPESGAEPSTQGSKSPPNCGGTSQVDPPADSDSGVAPDAGTESDILWIGGAIAATAIAAIAVLMLLRPKKKKL